MLFLYICLMEFIQSIYNDYNEYLTYVKKKTKGDVFAEDIVSATISNVYNMVKAGIKTESQISTNGKMNKSYFYACLKTSIANYHRKEVHKTEISNCKELTSESDTDVMDLDLKRLNERLNAFGKLSDDNFFHVCVFKFFHYSNRENGKKMTIAHLSRLMGINSRRLRDSRDFMNLIVQRWLKEEQRKQALKDWATP